MKRQLSSAPRIVPGTSIKVRLNSRTIIFVRTQQALAMWLEKYPDAQIIP